MRAALKVVRPAPTATEVSELGHKLVRQTLGLDRHIAMNVTAKPATIGDLLRALRGEAPAVGVDFAYYDALLAEAREMTQRVPDASFMYMSQPMTFADVVADLERSLAAADEWRSRK